VSDRKASETKVAATDLHPLVTALAIVALAAVVAVPLLLRGDGTDGG
jgi:hypothetical protein